MAAKPDKAPVSWNTSGPERGSNVMPVELDRVTGLGAHGGMHLEYELRAGRPVVVGLYIHGDAITTATLRELPFQVVTANTAAHLARTWLKAAETPADPRLSELRKLSELRRKESAGIRARRAERGRERRARIKELDKARADGLTVEFYNRFAEVYADAARDSSAPAVYIAEVLGVPRGTVHRWTREARLVGALPPGRKGAAG